MVTRDTIYRWPRGLMDKASDFESEDCEFESRRGRSFFFFLLNIILFDVVYIYVIHWFY